MPDEKLPLLYQAGIPGLLAGIMQLSMAFAIGKIPPAAQMAGAVVVSGLVGGGASVICVEGFHLSNNISGIIGGAIGAVPAVFWGRVAQAVAQQQVKQRLGVEDLGSEKPKASSGDDQNA